MRLFDLALFAAVLCLTGTALGAPPDKTPDQVEVTNFPAVQDVDGAVEVTNLPAIQDVNVTNLPTCNAGPEARYQLVGFTSSTLLGDSGVLSMTLACQQDFSGSRMCSSAEVVETVAVPLGLVGSAWVRPSFVPFHDTVGGASALDVSGYATSVTNLTCRTSAFVMTSSGNFTISQCANELAVACCALVP